MFFKQDNMKRISIIVAAAMAFFAVQTASAQSKTFKLGQWSEIQNSIIKELNRSYVDSLPVDRMMRAGINAMLRELDPYTIYIPEEENEDLQMMLSNTYGGIGAIIQKQVGQNLIINEPYEGSPAQKAGLRCGDEIIAIDGISIKDFKSKECTDRMKGKPGTSVAFTVLKGLTGDTLDITVVRERIHMPDIEYAGMIDDTTGYILQTGFTENVAADIRTHVLDLKQKGMKRFVLDLRGNGGGLINEAISIVSLFVPKGTLVVSSKGCHDDDVKEFHTTTEPIDTEIPIIVMIDSGSASASEIVAGALQDYDRAVIIGTRSYGKGLVQSIKPVSYNGQIKVTTSKYFTPSGRCVQAIDYSNRNPDGSVGVVPDSLKKAFKTLKKGRTVYDGGGITPDTLIMAESYSRPAYSLVANDIFGEYAIEYYKKHPVIASPLEFALTDAEYEDFVKFASKKNFDSRSAAQAQLDQMLKAAKSEDLYEPYKAEFDALEKKLTISKEEMLRVKKAEFKPLLEEEIAYKYYYTPGRVESIIRNDKQLHKTLDLIK
jgi:carboxyl-terminal processing protease